MDERVADERHAPVRQMLLLVLRREGPLAPDAVAARMGMSRTAILQQLRALATDGLVERQAVRHGVGRPRHLYDVTDRAQSWFPAGYDRLADTMLRAVQTIGGEELVERLFDVRRGDQATAIRARFEARGLAGAPLAARVRELAVIQDEQGYVCEVEEDGDLLLREHNCPISAVAASTPSACRAEERLFRDVLDAEVVRERHIAAGERCCEYRIRPRPGATQPHGDR